MEIKPFFDPRTFTLTYVVYDAQTRDAVVIDPVLDYEPVGSKVFTESADEVLAFVQAEGLDLKYVLETHAHADHLSGSQYLKERVPGLKVAIGSRIKVVQETFKAVFGLPDDFATDGRQFDTLLEDGQVLQVGPLKFEMIFTPGHTPACGTFKIDDKIFTGDLLFMPDQGTGRCDFPAGSAQDMYRSIKERIYTLPDATEVYTGHDYQPGGREVQWKSTVAEQKAKNVQLDGAKTYDDFVAARTARDATLSAPRLLFQSVQVNIDAGHLPASGYLKVPVNVFKPAPTNLEIAAI
ncbi:MAG: MBL fold metallo-hydrolase [Myxococcales bacterium]|nr:MBL fold metallo-hydrolase [Myxococcales bacterium]MCB9525193.1 MBL fold metallo-hydrolase [Myxococcales bacterium]